ncbi:transposon Tf2-1 polyprotein isoform X1 [Cucumis melo var. makuwa]|uniref:Transposon Tf2-1 polyprotein isoform X1 n=1 Tax=Cucumis melo var. makuwa TaxID=1194695 RepID=A0A5A7U3T1_CUCMM|nr:transposon Tf2-1 polyprotein isoform X1 [Cucumis melo var. makuwa]TYK07662.1 transposon Tf2-1 polyprotein isoform X1 [Cucumis melo var. makuwa]
MVQTRIEERLEVIDQEIALMKKELGKMPIIELSLNDIAKNMQTMRAQSDKQEQMMLMIMETIAKDRTTTSERNEEPNAHMLVTNKGKEKEANSSKLAVSGRSNSDDRNEGKTETEEAAADRNKFKKVEMPVFAEEDPDSWLFKAERSSRDGTILGKFLQVKQESTVDDYRNLFDKLVAPLSDVPDPVVEDTFMNGLFPWIRAEVILCRPKGLAEMTEFAQLVKNREIVWNEANLNNLVGGKYFQQNTINNRTSANTHSDNKTNTNFPMRTITLRSSNKPKFVKLPTQEDYPTQSSRPEKKKDSVLDATKNTQLIIDAK